MNRVLHPLSSITKHHNTIIITRKQELLLGRYNIRKFVSHIASPSASSFSNNNDNTSPRCYSRNTTPMKLQFSKWAVLLLSTSRYSSAWTQRNTPIYQSATSSSSSSFFMSKSAFSSMDDDSKIATLSLSVPPPEETTTMKKTMKMMMIPQEGNVVADGQIVSSFRGGLISVRVDDDFVEGFPTTTTNTPPSMMVSPASGKENPKSSLGGDLTGRLMKFPNGQMGVVVAHRPPLAFVYLDRDEVDDDDDEEEEEEEEMEGNVQVLDTLASITIDETKRVVDCFGRSKLMGGFSDDDEAVGTIQRAIFAPIPKVSDIALINTPLLTGVTMFDALAPIGRGQNMLVVGHDITDMRQYICSMLSVQVKEGTKCVYASTTADSEDVMQMLTETGLADDITVVLGKKSTQPDHDPQSMAAEATVVAATACSIAESFALEKGADTLVIVDTLDYHKCLWDATTRVLVDVFGVEAVVKSDRDGGASSEMRAFFSSLVQRSAKYNEKNGGGSVTLVLLCTIPKAVGTNDDTVFTPEDFSSSPTKVQDRIDFLVKRNVPLTGATLRKIQIPIPTDVDGAKRLALQHVDDLISMSDGQIWFDEDLETKGRRPAMDFQRSVTRVGIGADTESRADAAAIRRIVEGLRLDLSQSLDLDGADLATAASKNQVRNALAWMLAMHQTSTSGTRTLSESCTALLAASKGYLGKRLDGSTSTLAGTEEGDKLMVGLFQHVQSKAADALEMIDSTHDMTEENQEAIEAAIQSYFTSSS